MQSAARKTAVAVVFATMVWESADAFMDILVGLTSQYSLFLLKIRVHVLLFNSSWDLEGLSFKNLRLVTNKQIR